MDCFKAYDLRGRIPDELNGEAAYRIGRAYVQFLRPERVVVGRDVRLTSEELCRCLTDGLTDGGADVFDLGLCGTEEVYHATFSQEMDGGIMVTASHNPMDYNGMKLVRRGSMPISGDSGLHEIHDLVAAEDFGPVLRKGTVKSLDIRTEYIDHLLGYVSVDSLSPLKVVVNAGNGCAGPVLDLLDQRLPFELIKVYHTPDGTFPNGIPNPLLPGNREATAKVVRDSGADVGIAWDGDFDRCFFFDERGVFIEGYYIVGLLASAMLEAFPGAKIIHDPRLTWNTINVIQSRGGVPVQSKTGHAFIKERMRQEDAVYGGEMSAHHYFRDFAYCDSGMIPWLMVLGLMCDAGKPLSALVEERMRLFPASGEINRRLSDAEAALNMVENTYKVDALTISRVDGLSMEFPDWRFNLRCSNTEPVLRLNVESRGDAVLMRGQIQRLLTLLDHFA